MLKSHNSCLHIFGGNFLLIIFHTISCRLSYSKTIRDISMKLDTLRRFVMYKNYNSCLCFFSSVRVFFECPFDYFPYNFVSALYLKLARDISMKLGTLIKHNEAKAL